MHRSLSWLAALALAACDPSLVDGVGDSDTDTAAVDTDTELGTEPDTEADTEPDTTPPPPPIVRFVALGDAGDNPEDQAAVGAQMATFCAAHGCQFALYLGDNFYDSGVDSYDSERFQINFEDPYADLDIPFYAVLGNHDLGSGGIGLDLDPDKANYQIDYTAQSEKWRMPSEYYVIGSPDVPARVLTLYGLDTTRLFWGDLLGNLNDQQDWLTTQLAASGSPWKIGFGHHPYISNGRHGNAGTYEGIPDWTPFTETVRGQYVKDLFDNVGCGGFDVYFSGHDHNRQYLPPPSGCDTLFIVSGAGVKTTDFSDTNRNVAPFQDDDERGFVWVELDGDTLTAVFVDQDGDEHGPFTHTRRP
jgi:hypothetical protein